MTQPKEKKGTPCAKNTAPLSYEEAMELAAKIHPDWKLSTDVCSLSREYQCKDFYATMALANAVAWIAHQQNHHPDLVLGYNRCLITYSTHTINGLSENDFICAAKIDQL